ncbi:acyltransferase family protein [Nakamurella leprariae]|uniref:Acyltransferase n=1 Tax=Nakamurella leprariae TaxID=2803911 RepID=A0A938YGI8_9ACTN|nr:acyltransferase [Nakamurella leprariae]MBM9467714.1 acyltransferase [Nakamurella leprariae]
MALNLQEAFDARRNSIGFLRWLLAFVVIFSHAGPLAGFYDSHSLGTQWSSEQSFGGVAVAGFFCLSGFLITRSRMGRSTVFRYFWRRVLRIFPAFWAALLLVVLVLAPIAWWKSNGTIRGYVSAPNDSPLTYFADNMWLKMNQLNIADMGAGTPLAGCCTVDWNGSAWTLFYEFKGYILIGLFGLFGILGHRIIATIAFLGMLTMNTLLFLGVAGNFAAIDPLMSDFYSIMLLTPFMFGMMLALWADRIPIDDRLALAAAAIAIFTYFIASGWNVYGQFAFMYVIIWAAVRLPLTRWEKYGDLSYGIYIYAWPIQQFGAFFGVERLGWFGYHLVIIVACHLAAYVSWHCIEKPAMDLKNWTPRWLSALMARGRPLNDRIKRIIVDPRFSTTHYANRLRNDRAALAQDRRDDHLTSQDPDERVHASESPRPPVPPVGASDRPTDRPADRDRAGLPGGR